jgi:DNA-binding CsgD family transcriptional regulator
VTSAGLRDRGREAFGRQRWAEAYAQLSAADQERPLEPDELERLATAAYLAGHDADSADAWARAHQELLARGEVPRAVRCAFWLAHGLLSGGGQTRGAAWIARARRLLEDGRHDCVEQGYLLLPAALQSLDEGDPATASATLRHAAEIGERFGDPDLVALARHGWGRALIRMGAIGDGVRLLDEAMVAADAGDVSPVVVGEVYCSVISGCLEVFDVRRAREWTAALTRWCESQPDLVLYSNQCLVRRAEILRLHGAWPEAAGAAQRACERCLEGLDSSAIGAAFYQRAELHRLQGQFAEAEDAYRQASRRGRKPQPGLALLRLAQGQVDVAEAAARSAVEEARERRTRPRFLPAHVEIMLAAGDVEAARGAAAELEEIAADLDAPFLRAVGAGARGAVLLAEGDARSALDTLRRAWADWQELEAPYEAARTRVLIGLACRQLGDQTGAEMEFDAARWTFLQLGAAPDATRIEELSRTRTGGTAAGLTRREMQVLCLVATGKTNRAIAAELSISEKTVARHVSNIFTKLGLSTRAAATAYAYQHNLV